MSGEYFNKIPDYINRNKELTSTEKLVFSDIFALTRNNGICTARNKYLAEIRNRKERCISDAISKLLKLKLISVSFDYTSNTRKITILSTIQNTNQGDSEVIIKKEIVSKKLRNVSQKIARRVAKNCVTGSKKTLGLYKDNNKITKQIIKRERFNKAPPVISLSETEFFKTFPKIKRNSRFNLQIHDPDALRVALLKQPWMAEQGEISGLKTILKYYNGILAGEYGPRGKTASTASDPAKNFMRHEINQGELNNIFTSLDDLDKIDLKKQTG